MNPTTRTHVTGEVRAVADGAAHVIELRPIVPFVVDDYGSVWAPDTFDEALDARLPTLAWGHSWVEPIGRGVEWAAEGDLRVIRFRLDDFDLVPRAGQAWAQVQSGTIDDCSVGFSNAVRRYGPELTPEELVRWPGIHEFIEKADLDEVSLVLRGAVPGAKVLAYRSRDGRALTVSEDDVVAAAKKIAAGELTEAEAKAMLALLADDTPDPGATGEPGGAPEGTVTEDLDAVIDAALEGAFGRSR